MSDSTTFVPDTSGLPAAGTQKRAMDLETAKTNDPNGCRSGIHPFIRLECDACPPTPMRAVTYAFHSFPSRPQPKHRMLPATPPPPPPPPRRQWQRLASMVGAVFLLPSLVGVDAFIPSTRPAAPQLRQGVLAQVRLRTLWVDHADVPSKTRRSLQSSLHHTKQPQPASLLLRRHDPTPRSFASAAVGAAATAATAPTTESSTSFKRVNPKSDRFQVLGYVHGRFSNKAFSRHQRRQLQEQRSGHCLFLIHAPPSPPRTASTTSSSTAGTPPPPPGAGSLGWGWPWWASPTWARATPASPPTSCSRERCASSSPPRMRRGWRRVHPWVDGG